jgi:hypothetical protein
MLRMVGMRSRTRAPGASLVEVLVVTVIIAIGLLGILRIFPRGFSGLAHSANVTYAARLSDLESEWWKSNASALPDAIAYRFSLNATGVDATIPPSDYSTEWVWGPGPGPPPPPEDSPPVPLSMWAIRDIIGEVARVGTDPPYYQVAFAPVEVKRDKSPTWKDITYDPIVYGARYSKLADEDMKSFYDYIVTGEIREGFYLLNNKTGQLTFNKSNRDRFFRADYSYVAGGQVFDVVGELFAVPAQSDTPTTVDADGQATGSNYIMGGSPDYVIDDSEVINRAFERVDQITGGDAYQYVLHADTGFCEFHPRASGWTVKIDYRVADWRTLREERVVPDIDPRSSGRAWCYPVRLALPKTLKVGDDLDDQGHIYRGIPGTYDPDVDPQDPGGTGLSVMVVGKVGGELYLEGTDFNVDYRRGVIRFAEGLAGKRVGIYYQADGGWAVQTQKAVVSYSWVGVSGDALYRKFQYLSDTDNRMYLYFEKSEEGKTVSIDYICRINGPSGVQSYTKTGELATIHYPLNPPNQNIDKPLAVLNDANGDDVLNDPVRILDDNGAYQYWTIDPTSINVLAVRGVSLKTRVYWNEGSKWYHQELDTILTRQGG